MERIKCVVVGDIAVDKTALCMSFATGKPPKHIPVCSDLCFKNEREFGNLILWNTAGHEEYDQLRTDYYPQTDVFLVLFSVMSPTSFENAVENWIPEIRKHAPNTPFLLVGTNVELRAAQKAMEKMGFSKQIAISKEQGVRFAKQLKAFKYLECSAITQEGLNDVFEEAVNAALMPKEEPEEQKRCVIS